MGDVNGSTHVFVSGTSSVWDVQGGGRAGYTKCAFTYVEISGEAEVRHAACGLVTDGNSSNNNITCSKGSKILVADEPRIAMLFGAGYDTWANPVYTNMREGKSIDVEIRGGEIGFVYGGGYRGTVGSNGNALTVTVTITGGKVLYDVFGGGRGGIDKMLRTASGKSPSGSGYLNSTGQSLVYGDVTVNISGNAVINGNVYGGGESVPRLTRYYGTTFTNNDTTTDVAKVIGNTSVNVSGSAVIKGGVFGAGKGIGFDGDGNIIGTYTPVTGSPVTYYYPKNLVLSTAIGDDGWKFLEWYNHSGESGSVQYDSAAASKTKYEEYAKTDKNASVTITGGTIGTNDVAANVYGGGAYSKTTLNSSLEISGGTVIGDAYGGGLGRLTKDSVLGSSSVEISGGTIGNGTLGGTVYGGSAYGVTVGNTSAAMSGGTAHGDVFGGGLGAVGTTSAIDSVRGNSSVNISGTAVIDGNVYGGSAFGLN